MQNFRCIWFKWVVSKIRASLDMNGNKWFIENYSLKIRKIIKDNFAFVKDSRDNSMSATKNNFIVRDMSPIKIDYKKTVALKFIINGMKHKSKYVLIKKYISNSNTFFECRSN